MTRAFVMCESTLKRFLGRFFYRPEDVDDFVQETFLRAYNASKSTDIRKPEAYLFRIAKYLALKELDLKSHKLTDFLEEVTDQESLPGANSVEEELMAEQQIMRYCNAIATLPPQCRKIFLMRKVQARSYREIADILGISLSAVEKHVAKGIKRFDDYMAEQCPLDQAQPEQQSVVDVAGLVSDLPHKEVT